MTWTEKPPSGTLLDTGHALYSGLVICIPMYEASGTSLYDPLRDLSYTLPTANWDVSGGLLFDADTDIFTVTYDTSLLDDFTIYIGGFDRVGVLDATTYFSGNNSGFRLYHSWTRNNLLSNNPDNRFESISYDQVGDNFPHGIYVVGKFSTQTATIYYDGSSNAHVMTTTGTPTTPTDTAFTVGGRAGQHVDGVINHFFVWDRQLSTAEIDSVQGNPWQIFLDAGAVEETLTDGVSISESNMVTKLISITITDGFKGAETSGGQKEGSQIVNDELITEEQLDSTIEILENLLDSGNVSEDLISSALINALASDGVELSEALIGSVAGQVFESLSEGFKLSDICVSVDEEKKKINLGITMKKNEIGISKEKFGSIDITGEE